MDQADAPTLEDIEKIVHPSGEDVTFAKQVIIGMLCERDPASTTLDDFVRQLLVSVDKSPTALDVRSLSQMEWSEQAEHIRWMHAARMGIAELAGEALALPIDGSPSPQPNYSVHIRTTNRGWSECCEHFQLTLTRAYRASSLALAHDKEGFVLRDPDLFLARIDAPAMNERVEIALREAVGCYRAGLYLGAAILVGSASEGAWLELATTVSDVLGDQASNKLRKELNRDTPGIEAIQRIVSETVRSHSEAARKSAAIYPGEWTKLVETASYYRNLRNYAIHFQDEKLDRLDYATVGILLLSATNYFNAVYRLRHAWGD